MSYRREVRGLCAVLGLVVTSCSPRPQEPSVILISLDTLRRDHLPMYGYARDTAPFLMSLSERAVVFERAFAQDTNTNPSHTSMLTGVYPHVHGSYANGVPLAPGRVTAAEILSGAGLRTAAFVSGATMIDKATGLSRGFEVYDDDFDGYRRDGRATIARASAWLGEISQGERYFLFVHLFDAHGPYLPVGKYEGLFRSETPGRRLPRIPDYQCIPTPDGRLERDANWYIDRYDAMIRTMDDCVAELLDAVDLAKTIVIVVADHGETLDERHGALGHGAEVYDEQIRIPLMVLAPPWPPGRIEGFVETIDLLPTTLELLGIDAAAHVTFQGRSLAPMVNSGAPGREFVFSSARTGSHYRNRDYRLDQTRRIHCVRSDDWKLMRFPGVESDYVELYDLKADPGERVDVADGNPELRDEYSDRLHQWNGDQEGATPVLDPELREKLESLGYVGEG